MTDLASDAVVSTARNIKYSGKAINGLKVAGVLIAAIAIMAGLVALLATSGDPGVRMNLGVGVLALALPLFAISPFLAIYIVSLVIKGIATMISNDTARRMLPNYTHVFGLGDGSEIYGDEAARKIVFGDRVYDFDDVSEIDYFPPRARVHMRRGPRAMETVRVGLGDERCSRFVRDFYDMLGYEFSGLGDR